LADSAAEVEASAAVVREEAGNQVRLMTDRLVALLDFLEDDPNDEFTRFALAQEYAKRGNREEALRYYEHLVETSPGYVGTYYHLGKLLEDLDRTDDAKDIYRTGIRIAEEQRDAHARAELNDALLQLDGLGWDDL